MFGGAWPLEGLEGLGKFFIAIKEIQGVGPSQLHLEGLTTRRKVTGGSACIKL